ncbi:MAG: transketolase C-terminal domain-containing protein [Chthoniobacterales bacterium]
MNSLNPKVFDEDVEQVAIRSGFGEGFLLAGKENPNVVGLCADLTDSTKMSLFKEAFPERFIEVGVAEQNLASVASGMAAMGKVPFISSYAMFSPGRNWEPIRTTICYNNVNVKIAGSHAGVSVGPDGGSHQALEDIAITRVLPRMTVISPCDAIEARKATVAAVKTIGPTYVRLAREKTPVITTEDTAFEIGKACIFYQGDKKAEVGVIATGALVHKALLAARQLEADGISIKVLNLSTIKPLDKDAVVSLARETHAIVTVEEHQITGGMGSAVAECLARNYPVRMAFIGVDDQFGQSGKPEELIAYYGMGTESIVARVREIRQRK